MFKHAVRFALVLLLAALVWLWVRYNAVQETIENAPLTISQYSKSGYTPKGVYGHGDLITQTGKYGWYVYDIADAVYGVKKVCAYQTEPDAAWDIDFVHTDNGWYKLRSGTGVITADGFQSEPQIQKWKNIIPTQLSFPVRSPDMPYRLKIFVSKIKIGAQSPLEYLQILKATNPSCHTMPSP